MEAKSLQELIDCYLNPSSFIYAERPCENRDFSSRLQEMPAILNEIIKYLELTKNSGNIQKFKQSQIFFSIIRLNAENSFSYPWTNDFIVSVTQDINELICELVGVSGLTELLVLKLGKGFLYQIILNALKESLHKTKWKTYITSIPVFKWIVLNVTYPNLSCSIELVFPVILNLLDDFLPENQILGLMLMQHFLSNVLLSEIRQLNHIDVIIDALKFLLASKDVRVLENLFPCLLKALNLKYPAGVEFSENPEIYDVIFDDILTSLELSTDSSVKNAFLINIPSFFEFYKLNVLLRMKKVFGILIQSLEIPNTNANIHSLKAIKSLFLHGWPRADNHFETVLKAIFRLILDITADGDLIKEEISIEIYNTLSVMSKLCPQKMSNICVEMKDLDWPGRKYLNDYIL